MAILLLCCGYSSINMLNFGHLGDTASGPYPPKAAHMICGPGDEQRVLTTGGGAPTAASLKYADRRPKFSSIVNEYVGNCFEEHCNIGKK